MDRISSGLSGLDSKLDGGLPAKTCTLISGGPGTGKTLLALNYVVEGASKGKKCVYISLSEAPEELLRACDSIASLNGAKDHVGKNLTIEQILLGEMVDLEYFTHLFDSYPQLDRLVIDNVNKLLSFATSKREYRINMGELIRTLKSKANSVLLLCEFVGKKGAVGRDEHCPAERFKTGIKELNDILKGGIPYPGSVLLQGEDGAGKTELALEALSGKESTIVAVLTDNTPKDFEEEVKSLNVKGTVKFLDCYSWLAGKPAEVDSLSNLSKLLVVIEDSLKKGTLVLFDSLTPLGFYNDANSIKQFIQELIAIVKANESLIVFILDLGTYEPQIEKTFESLVGGVIHLDREKGLKVLKMHATKTVNKFHFYEVTDRGIKLRSK